MTVSEEAINAAWRAFNTAPSGIDEMRAALISAMPFMRAYVIEECAKVAEGVPCESAGDEYQTSGNGNFWDISSAYGHGRNQAAEEIRALADAETKETP